MAEWRISHGVINFLSLQIAPGEREKEKKNLYTYHPARRPLFLLPSRGDCHPTEIDGWIRERRLCARAVIREIGFSGCRKFNCLGVPRFFFFFSTRTWLNLLRFMKTLTRFLVNNLSHDAREFLVYHEYSWIF